MYVRKGLRACVYGHYYTQQRFAEAVGMDPGWISRLIHCQGDPTEDQARRIMATIREADPQADAVEVFRRHKMPDDFVVQGGEERDPATGLPVGLVEAGL